MRGIETQVRKIRRQIFAEVSRIGFESDDGSLIHDIEAIPYKIVTEEGPQYRDSIYRARAIATERVRLAMGMCLRPTNKPVHLTDGIESSNISEKYYEPPLMPALPARIINMKSVICAKAASPIHVLKSARSMPFLW